MMFTRLQKYVAAKKITASLATHKTGMMTLCASAKSGREASFNATQSRSLTITYRNNLLSAPRRTFTSTPEDGGKSDPELQTEIRSQSAQLLERDNVEAETNPDAKVQAQREIIGLFQGKKEKRGQKQPQRQQEEFTEEQKDPQHQQKHKELTKEEKDQQFEEQSAYLAAASNMEQEMLRDIHSVLKGVDPEASQDLQGVINREQSINRVEIIKKFMLSPDYRTKQALFNQVSPDPLSSIQEQKDRAVHQLAAFNRSAEILKVIKQKLSSDGQVKAYLVSELKKSGSEFGDFLADEIQVGERTPAATTKQAKIFQDELLEKEKVSQHLMEVTPLDQYTFNTYKKYGPNAFVPASSRDRFPRHEKNQIASFEEYVQHLNKLGLDKRSLAMARLETQLQDIYERYCVPEVEREYSIVNEYEPEDPRHQEFIDKWNNLYNEIPEIAVALSAPTIQDEVALGFRQSFEQLELVQNQMEEARAPLIKKQLEKYRPEFEKLSKGMNLAQKERAWNEVTAAAAEAPFKDDSFEKLQEAMEQRLKAAERISSLSKEHEKSAVEILQEHRYQAIKDEKGGPLSIDRVTRDGPRDLRGEALDLMQKGLVFDMSKAPDSDLTPPALPGEESSAQGATKAASVNPADVYRDNLHNLQSHLADNFEFAKRIESAIEAQRRKVADNMLDIQERLDGVQAKKKQLLKSIKTTHATQVEQQVFPESQSYEFIKFQDDQLKAETQKQLKEEQTQLLKNHKVIGVNSKQTKDYEDELKLLSCNALLREALGQPNDDLEHFKYVLDLLGKNKVQSSVHIEARCFEYALLGGDMTSASKIIAKLTSDRSELLSPIDPRYLQKFFTECVKKDYIDGVAHLVNYCDRYSVDTSNYPVNSFRSALDHYLNRQFDLSKIMIFLKFYQRHINDRAQLEFSKIDPIEKELSDGTLLTLSQNIFKPSEGLVDFCALVDFLVEQVGTRQIIDPITREDSLWKLIESQTYDKDFIKLASLSVYNGLSGRTVAKYLGNQLSRSTSFDRTFRTALRLQGTPLADAFYTELIQHLNRYALANGNQLPPSFSQKRLNDLYVRLKLSGSDLSPGMSELLLFCLNTSGMTKEIVDICAGQKSDIHRYHLAESLFTGKINGQQSFSDALIASQSFDEPELSACQLTQRTKALFLDGNDKGAVDFFRSEIHKREERAKERKDLIIALYDNVMATSADEKLSFEDFKAKHRRSALLSKSFIQQAFAVSTLNKIVRSNDYDGIDNAFNLYMVLQQERDLTGEKFFKNGDEAHQLLHSCKTLNASQKEQLRKILERKKIMLKKVHAEDYQRLRELVEIAGNEKLQNVQGLNQKALNHMLSLFQEMTYNEVNQYMKSLNALPSSQGVGSQGQIALDDIITDEVDGKQSWFQEFIRQKTELKQKALEDVLDYNRSFESESKPPQSKKKPKKNDDSNQKELEEQNRVDRMLLHAKLSNQIEDGTNIAQDRIELLKTLRKTEKKIEKIKYEEKKMRLNRDNEAEDEEEFIKFQDQYKQETYEIEEKQQQILKVVPLLEAAVDVNKEELLQVNSDLYVLHQVLINEMKTPRFATPGDNISADLTSEMKEYAKTIQLLRLQVKDLQSTQAKLYKKIKKGPQTKYEGEVLPIHQALYKGLEDPPKNLKIHEEDASDELDQLDRLNQKIYQHFSLKEPMKLSYSILPEVDTCQKLEKIALRQAQDEFDKRNDDEDIILQDEEEPMLEKSFMITKNQKQSAKRLLDESRDLKFPWKDELAVVEANAKVDAFDHFYLDQKILDSSGQQSIEDKDHPRLLLEEIVEGMEDRTDKSELLKQIFKRRGLFRLNKAPIEDPDPEELEKKESQKMYEFLQDKIENQDALLLRNPVDYFLQARAKEAMQALRSRQLYPKPGELYPREDWDTLTNYNNSMLNQGVNPGDNFDPINYERYAHDLSIHELKEGLSWAVNERKSEALPLAVSIFNKIHDKYVRTIRFEEHNAQSDDISKQLDQFEILINEKTSPLMSTLNSCRKYVFHKLPETLDAYRATVKDGDITNQPIDLNRMINDYQAINKTKTQLSEMDSDLNTIENRLLQEQKQFNQKFAEKNYELWLKQSKERIQKAQDDYLQKLYEDYLLEGDKISDDTKVKIMKDVFTIQIGENFINTDLDKSNSSFPVFFAHDLLKFGLRNKIPGAIRLGELVLAEHCPADAKMPEELARTVKNYMIEHQDQYQAAAKFTGPISVTQIYHQAQQSGKSQQPVFMTMDDPYWVQLQRENYRREDNWRLPSAHAWSHKPFGIFGEILDLKRFESEIYEQQLKI